MKPILRNACDAWLDRLSEDDLLELLGPEDGKAYDVMTESILEDQRDRGLSPEQAVMRRVVAKWDAKRTKKEQTT